MAFLKRVESKGFKSFAHKTVVEFIDGLIVIVGPNGSGKSNINDAIKWVLGETSKKVLRASSASDMIFSGSEKEKEADMAEVTLVFNNEDKVLDINYSEVSVTRRSYRHQDHNEYFINKNLVRRKDIKNLFLDTGLGNTDLSIISQDSVSRVTTAKPEDLKDLLNEASGVARYHQQKIESVKKLEKVSQNLNIFIVKLKEMDRQIGPLKKAKVKAEKYVEIKGKLGEIELSLIKEQLEVETKRKNELENILLDTEAKKNTSSTKIDESKEKQHLLQVKMLKIESELFSLQSKESELSLSKISDSGDTEKDIKAEIKETLLSIEDVKQILEEANDKEIISKENLVDLRDEEFEISQKSEKLKYELNSFEYELNKFSTSNYDKLSKGTRTILENKSIFNEVYGLVSELISFKDNFATAINVSLGNRLNNIVVSDEKVIKEAIKFLKINKYGSATFMPTDKIKERFIQEQYIAALQNVDGYLGILSSVIKVKSTFKKIVSSLAGNILLFENIGLGLKAAKLTGYKFTIVTLEGDIIFPGFIVRGGQNKGENNFDRKKQLSIQTDTIRANFKESLSLHKQAKENILTQTSYVSAIHNEQVRSQERITYLETNLQKLLDQFKFKTGKSFDLSKVKGVKRKLSSLSLEQIKNRIKTIQTEIQTYQKDLMELQKWENEFRTTWKISIESNSSAVVEFNKLEANIKVNLEILNKDYKMTWEALERMEIPKLKMKYDKASSLRVEYREEIAELGFVDVESIERYNKIAEDYDELKINTEDLTESRMKLLSTIELMDEKMEVQLKKTFIDVNKKFQITFETLFRGGKAEIIFSEPENILESGVEIIAKAPGKQIKNINLYSGGEKSMIALSLIFAINEVRKLPLLLLDEVEASLDEANVERFANFVKRLNENTQLIVVTHRPGTMERADVLYGVTMQEKGITKIVSVKLEEAVDLTN